MGTQQSSLSHRRKVRNTNLWIATNVYYYILHAQYTHFITQWIYSLSFCSLKKMKNPILFLHAEDDHLVPFPVAQQVCHPVDNEQILLNGCSACSYQLLIQSYFSMSFCFKSAELASLPSCRCIRSQWVPRMQNESNWSPLTDLRDTCTTAYTETQNFLVS